MKILTKDNMTVFVNAIIYYKVAKTFNAVANVDAYGGSARLLAATTLRNVLGTLTLGDILCQRESIAKEMKVLLHYLNICLHIFIVRKPLMREQSRGV